MTQLAEAAAGETGTTAAAPPLAQATIDAALREAIEDKLYPYGIRDRERLGPGQFICTYQLSVLAGYQAEGATDAELSRFLFDNLSSGLTRLRSGGCITFSGTWDAKDRLGRRICRPVLWVGKQDWSSPVRPEPTLSPEALFAAFRRAFGIPVRVEPVPATTEPRLDGEQWSVF